MQPAAVLSAIVRVQGIKPANVALGGLQTNLVKTDRAATATSASAAKAGRILKGGLAVGAVAAAYGLMKGVKAGATFEKQMDSLMSVSKANRREMKLLEKQALEFGETTVFSANDAAKAQTELAKGGLTVEQIYKGGLSSALHLAAAGEMELADAAIITANAMKLFKLRGKDAEEVADMMAIAANKTTAEVYDFGMALKQGGGVARLVGYDLNKTMTILEALAEAGVKNSDAGTSMKAAMIQLVTPSKKQKELTKELGIEWFNAHGSMKDAAGISSELQRATEGMTKAERGNVLATLAGTDGIRTLNALYEAGPDALRKLSKANEENGYAAQVTAEKTDNLAGDWERLVNMAEVVGIKIEQFLNPILRKTIQFLTDLVKSPSQLKVLIKPAVVVATYIVAKKIIKLWRWLAAMQISSTAQIAEGNSAIVLSNEGVAASYLAAAAAAETSAAAQVAASATAAKASGWNPGAVGPGQGAAKQAAATATSRALLEQHYGGYSASSMQMGKKATDISKLAYGNSQFGAKGVDLSSAFYADSKRMDKVFTSVKGKVGSFYKGVGGIAKTGAMNLSSAMAGFLPGALAAVGVGNILTSAIEGDDKGAMFKAGGAAAGAIAGGMAFGLPGALAGAGIGSILGGIVGNMFGAGDVMHPLQEKLKEQSKSAAEAWRNQREALGGLRTAEENSAKAKGRNKEATQRVTTANRHLNNVIEKYGPVSRQAHRAELALAKARRENTAAANGERKAERLSENQQKLLLLRSREVVAHEKQRVPTIQQTIKQLTVRSNHDKNNIGVLTRLVNAENKLAQSQGRIKQAIGDVAAIAPKQANALRRMDSIQAQFGTNLRGLSQIYKSHKQIATQGMMQVGNAWMDYKGTMHTASGSAKLDILSFTNATTTGLATTRQDLYKFAGELGIKNVKFGAKGGEGKKQKKQKGGMVVPGAGTGDKVPMTAWVEPGEVVHVLNMKAAGDRDKLGQLEAANNAVPRHGSPKFQLGGTMVDPRGPGTGVVNKAIAGVVGDWSSKYDAAINYGYDPGGGHISPGHNVTGTATDTGPAAGWGSGPTNLFETGLRAIQGKVDQILYGSHGIGEAYPNHGWGNHAHIEWGMHPEIQGILGSLLKKMEFTGPPGMLQDVGQGILDSAVAMANQKMKALGATGGGADTGGYKMSGTMSTGEIESLWKSVNPKMGDAHLMAAIAMAESSGIVNNVGNDPGGTEGLGLWQITTGFNDALISKLGGKQAMFNPAKNALAAASILREQGLDAWVVYNTGAYSQFMQEGGLLGGDHMGMLKAGGTGKGDNAKKAQGKSKDKEKAKSPFKKPLQAVAGPHFKKGKAQVRKLNRKLEGMGFDPDSPIIKNLARLSTDVEKYDEYASNASALTVTEQNEQTGEEEIFPGVFKGGTEVGWLNNKLGSLMSLRKQLIDGHGTVDTKVDKTTKLIHEAKKRLNKVRKMIAKGEDRKREIEQKIKDLEKSRDDKVKQIEREKKELEQKLDKAQSAKTPNKAYINQLRDEIQSKTFAINHEGESARDAIKVQNEAQQKLKVKQAGRRRVEDALSNTLIPTLETKRADLLQTGVDLYSSGGSVGALSYMGLQTVQGQGGSLGEVPNPPEIGTLGGEVFSTQNRLRELNAEKKKVPVKDSAQEETEKLIKELKLAEEMEWKKRFIASQYQSEVIKNFPTTPEISKIPGYVLGGITSPAWVGERGKELLFPPVGSRVVSHREAVQASGDHQGGGPLVIESLVINEAEGTAVARVEGKTTEAEIKHVTRKQSRGAMSPTPGGTTK